MSEDEFIFPQRILRGLGLLKQSSTGPHLVPQSFGWDENGGYWSTAHGQPKPSTTPPGSSATSGEWVKVIPYGQRISVGESRHGVLVRGGGERWVWYPLPKSTPQWMNDQVWALNSDAPPTIDPTGHRPAISPPPSLTTPAPLPDLSSTPGNSWVTTAGGYWIWVYVKPAPALEAP
jgi:hypothetical protein